MTTPLDTAFSPYENMLRQLAGGRLVDTSSFLAMMDEAVIVEHPYAKQPPHRFDGIAAFREHAEQAASIFEIDRAEATSHYSCDDGGTTIAEFAISGQWKPSGIRFDQNGVIIMKIADGYITHYIEYWNPLLAKPSV